MVKVRVISFLAFIAIMLAWIMLSGCRTQKDRAHEYMLKSEALSRPMLHLKGKTILICVEGGIGDAEFDIYNPGVAAAIAESKPESFWKSLGLLLGGIGAGAIKTGVLDVAVTNGVVLYSGDE